MNAVAGLDTAESICKKKDTREIKLSFCLFCPEMQKAWQNSLHYTTLDIELYGKIVYKNVNSMHNIFSILYIHFKWSISSSVVCEYWLPAMLWKLSFKWFIFSLSIISVSLIVPEKNLFIFFIYLKGEQEGVIYESDNSGCLKLKTAVFSFRASIKFLKILTSLSKVAILLTVEFVPRYFFARYY